MAVSHTWEKGALAMAQTRRDGAVATDVDVHKCSCGQSDHAESVVGNNQNTPARSRSEVLYTSDGAGKASWDAALARIDVGDAGSRVEGLTRLLACARRARGTWLARERALLMSLRYAEERRVCEAGDYLPSKVYVEGGSK